MLTSTRTQMQTSTAIRTKIRIRISTATPTSIGTSMAGVAVAAISTAAATSRAMPVRHRAWAGVVAARAVVAVGPVKAASTTITGVTKATLAVYGCLLRLAARSVNCDPSSLEA